MMYQLFLGQKLSVCFVLPLLLANFDFQENSWQNLHSCYINHSKLHFDRWKYGNIAESVPYKISTVMDESHFLFFE